MKLFSSLTVNENIWQNIEINPWNESKHNMSFVHHRRHTTWAIKYLEKRNYCSIFSSKICPTDTRTIPAAKKNQNIYLRHFHVCFPLCLLSISRNIFRKSFVFISRILCRLLLLCWWFWRFFSYEIKSETNRNEEGERNEETRNFSVHFCVNFGGNFR